MSFIRIDVPIPTYLHTEIGTYEKLFSFNSYYTLQVIIRSLLYNEDVETAIRMIVFHHQLTPMKCQVYSGRLSPVRINHIRLFLIRVHFQAKT